MSRFLTLFPLLIVPLFFIIIYGLPTSAYSANESSSESSDSHWTSGKYMITPRSAMGAVALDEKIYTVGGQGSKIKKADIVEIYDIKTNNWTKGVPLPEPLDHIGIDTFDGKIYVVGGSSKNGYSNRLWIYDPLIDKWTQGKPMPGARTALTANFVNGKLYAIGGVDDVHNVVPTNFVYDPLNDTWNEKSSMPTARHHATSSVVDGKLYVIGGRIYGDGIPEPIAKALSNFDLNEMYDPATDTWTKLNAMPSKRSGLASAPIGNDIYVFGGEKVNGTFENNEKYDTVQNVWTLESPLPTPRLGLKAVTVDDTIYVIGGKTWYYVAGQTEIFHPSKQ